MNRNPLRRIALAAIALPLAALMLQSCATAPSSQAAAGQVSPQKTAKERTVIVKIPVLIKVTRYYSDGLVDQYTDYKLSADMKTLLEESVYDGSRPDPVQRIAYAYEGGRRVRESVYESDGELRSRKEISYDAAGRVAAELTFDSKGAAVSSSAYSYDASGNMTEWIARDGSGAVQAAVAYRWKDGRLESILMADSSGAPTGSVALEYGPGGLVSKRRYLDASGVLQKSESYAYSAAILSSIEYRRGDGVLSSRTAYELGSSGERVSETHYDRTGGVIGRARYEYKVREESMTETYFE